MLGMAVARGSRPWPEEQAATALGSPVEMVDPAGLGEAALFATEDVAIDARLQAVLVVGDGVEAEVEDTLAVSLAHGVGEEESQQALAVVRMGLAEQASERPEESHFAQLSAQQACPWAVCVVCRGGCCLRLERSVGVIVGGHSCLGQGSHSLGTVSHGAQVSSVECRVSPLVWLLMDGSDRWTRSMEQINAGGCGLCQPLLHECFPRHVCQGYCSPDRCTTERLSIEVERDTVDLAVLRLRLADVRVFGGRRGPWSWLAVRGDCCRGFSSSSSCGKLLPMVLVTVLVTITSPVPVSLTCPGTSVPRYVPR